MWDGLKSIAERILPFDKGNFSPSPLPALVNVVTDELLVMAKEIVAAVAAAAQPKLSGKAQLRLLAWVVADARGARVAMEKALAETVGKRLDRQADIVAIGALVVLAILRLASFSARRQPRLPCGST